MGSLQEQRARIAALIKGEKKHERHGKTYFSMVKNANAKCKTLPIRERYCKIIDKLNSSEEILKKLSGGWAASPQSKPQCACAAYNGILPIEFMDCNPFKPIFRWCSRPSCPSPQPSFFVITPFPVYAHSFSDQLTGRQVVITQEEHQDLSASTSGHWYSRWLQKFRT